VSSLTKWLSGMLTNGHRLPMLLVSAESARKWLALSFKRRAHYSAMRQSGRWSRHFTEDAFQAAMAEVIADCERWQVVVDGFREQTEDLAA